MKQGKLVGVAVSAVIVMAALAMFFSFGSAQQLNQPGGSKPDDNYSIGAQWVDYADLRNLTKSADAVIVGRVLEVKTTHDDVPPLTDFAVSVEKVLKKSDLQAGDTITVRQIGGGKAFVESDRLMNAGESYVLFLGYTPDTQTYAALGGPQGKFMVQGDKVFSMDNFDQEASFVHTKIKGMPLSNFEGEVSAIVKEDGEQ